MNRSILRFSTSLLILSLLLVACGSESQDSQSNSGDSRRLVYGLTLLPSGFDPHVNASSELGIPFMSVYDTLVYRHPQTQNFEPGLAESWEVLEGGTRYVFTLKQSVTFHDGQPFNAAAVGVTFDRVLAEETASQKAKTLLGPNYERYTIVDDFTFEIILSAPYEPLLDALSQVYWGIASPLALANHTDGTYQWNQVGTGPYKLKEVVPGERIVLERNLAYAWGPPFYALENPNPVQEVEFRFYTDPATRDDALQAGEVGMMGELLPLDVELLLGNSDLRIYPSAVPGQPMQFLFNTARLDLNTRRALIHATNRTDIVDAVFAGQSRVAYGPLTSNVIGYNPAVESTYPFDLSAAEAYFRQARIADSDDDGALDREGEPLRLTLLVPPWNLLPEVAQALAGQWRPLGIEVTIEQVPNFPTLLEKIAEGEYDLVALNDFGMDASVLNSYYLSDGRNNVTGYSDPQLDEYLTLAIAELDPTTRANLYGAAQTLIMDQALLLPIREHTNLNGATATLDGVIFDAHGWWPLLVNFTWAEGG